MKTILVDAEIATKETSLLNTYDTKIIIADETDPALNKAPYDVFSQGDKTTSKYYKNLILQQPSGHRKGESFVYIGSDRDSLERARKNDILTLHVRNIRNASADIKEFLNNNLN